MWVLSKVGNLLSGTDSDYTELSNYTVTLKVWFPEVVREVLNELSEHNNESISTIVRRTLYVYLYGSYDHMVQTERALNAFRLNESGVSESRDLTTNNRTPELGKNAHNTKVWIAIKMKEDLQELADTSGMKLSVFVRELLISNLFGHTYLPERDEMVDFRVKVK